MIGSYLFMKQNTRKQNWQMKQVLPSTCYFYNKLTFPNFKFANLGLPLRVILFSVSFSPFIYIREAAAG